MADLWKTIYKGELEGRSIEVEEYDDGGYRVITTQKEDNPGSVSSEETSVIIIPPTEAGREIHIEGETKKELIKEMMNEGFSEVGVKGVVDNL